MVELSLLVLVVVSVGDSLPLLGVCDVTEALYIYIILGYP